MDKLNEKGAKAPIRSTDDIMAELDDLILKCSIRSQKEREQEKENTFDRINEYLEYIRADYD